jgi:hypothetical protein
LVELTVLLAQRIGDRMKYLLRTPTVAGAGYVLRES